MINIAICDDEDIFIRKIELIVKAYFMEKDIEVSIDSYVSSYKFCELKEQMKKYDIVFMDINMEKIDGIEAAKKLREYCPDTYLIFVTAFINYTLEGYKVEAIRYILKEYNDMQVNISEALDAIVNKMNLDSKKIRYDFVRIGEREVSLNDIVYVDNNLHKITLHLLIKGKEENYELYKKLSEIEEEFESQYLIRTHQSYLVNMKYAKLIKRYEVVLSTGKEIPVSKAKYNFVKGIFMNQLGEI